jgi:hypothetical protein
MKIAAMRAMERKAPPTVSAPARGSRKGSRISRLAISQSSGASWSDQV